ncbi:MAG: PfkB family carbohydrate kinase [Anaerolineae bacterium]
MIDYLGIGNVTEDIWPDHVTPGGPVTYAARAATTWLSKVAILTAASADFDMAAAFPQDNVVVHRLDSPVTTRFRNVYTPEGRKQQVWPSPVRITASHLTQEMLDCPLVHLAPVANEINPDVVFRLPSTAFIGVAPQGWMRRWTADGIVYVGPWEDSTRILGRANAAVISVEDVNHDWDLIREWASATAILAVTQGPEGCTVFVHAEPTQVPPTEVDIVDTTGAGDAFTASLFVALQQGLDPIRAARLANCVAAHSVAHAAGQWFPTRQDVLDCIAATA